MHCMTGANKNSAQCMYVQIQSNLWMVYQTGFWNVSYCQQLQHVGLHLTKANLSLRIHTYLSYIQIYKIVKNIYLIAI